MAKSNPIGVRFDPEVLEILKGMGVDSPQKALNFLEQRFLKSHRNLKTITYDGPPAGKDKFKPPDASTMEGTFLTVKLSPAQEKHTPATGPAKLKTLRSAKVKEMELPAGWSTMSKTERLRWLRENRK